MLKYGELNNILLQTTKNRIVYVKGLEMYAFVRRRLPPNRIVIRIEDLEKPHHPLPVIHRQNNGRGRAVRAAELLANYLLILRSEQSTSLLPHRSRSTSI